MHLSGHYSNPPEALEGVLRSASEGSSACHGVARAVVPEGKRLGNGVVQGAVTKALADADRPMEVGEVRRAVEDWARSVGQSKRSLDVPVSGDSVSSCLSTGARAARPRFERVTRGRYQLTRSR